MRRAPVRTVIVRSSAGRSSAGRSRAAAIGLSVGAIGLSVGAIGLSMGPSSHLTAQQAAPEPAPHDPDGFGPIGEGCSDEGYRAFDFWLGSWSVANANGDVVGTSQITRISNGCAVLEHWVGGGGVPGQSLNHYDPVAGGWRQRWVGGNGQILDIEGGLEGESMILSGERMGDGGPVRDRITWSPMPDGTVRQKWDISRDGGKNWEEVFLGIYSRSD